MNDTLAEQVLVVPTARFHELGHFQGFCREADRYLRGLLSAEHLSFRPRAEVEQDPGFKQLIPYVVFQYRGPDGQPNVFHYRRGKGQGENRLHSKRSVGIGGHIASTDAADLDANDAYLRGMRREVEEEVVVEAPYRQRCAGLINDDQTDVGKVHLGVVHLADLEQPAIRPRESDIAECGFAPIADLLDDLGDFETWSQICLRALFAEPAGRATDRPRAG